MGWKNKMSSERCVCVCVHIHEGITHTDFVPYSRVLYTAAVE